MTRFAAGRFHPDRHCYYITIVDQLPNRSSQLGSFSSFCPLRNQPDRLERLAKLYRQNLTFYLFRLFKAKRQSLNITTMNQTSELKASILDLLQRYQSLVLATADQNGTPNSSHAPYLLQGGNFFILVSGLAKHTANLLQSRRCHIQILADEQETVNPFARKRLSYLCAVEVVSPQSKDAAELLVLMRQRFGPTVDMLASLSDFQLLRLVPESGSVVLGFGQAHPAPLPSQLG